jgi:hypothetical protein
MSKRSDGLTAESLDNRWSFTDVKTNSALTTASVGDTQSTREMRHLDFLSIAILNKSTPSHTVSAAVRDASAAGTVLAQWALIIGSSQVAHVNPAGIHLTATQGKGLFVTLDTVAPSVTAAVNAAGWTDAADDH